EHTVGPWDERLQHAGPPSALIGRALELCEPRDGMVLSRLTFELLGAVPVGDLEIEAHVVRPGRSVELLEAELRAGGRAAMLARAWRVTAAPVDRGPIDSPPPPVPDEQTPLPEHLTWSGYLNAIEWRFPVGSWDRPGPATAWTRMKHPLVPDEEPSPLQRVLTVADSASGISATLDWSDWMFINPELTVHALRPARGEWICMDAATSVAAGGAGLASSVLSDADGPVARGAQSLLVRRAG
ncbi:MAG: hypothetical protein QOJ07_196, partial [Thermoleophilaceae bacterium]|nr:hypothetical protein [Thermoleophilaceae bacterium]